MEPSSTSSRRALLRTAGLLAVTVTAGCSVPGTDDDTEHRSDRESLSAEGAPVEVTGADPDACQGDAFELLQETTLDRLDDDEPENVEFHRGTDGIWVELVFRVDEHGETVDRPAHETAAVVDAVPREVTASTANGERCSFELEVIRREEIVRDE